MKTISINEFKDISKIEKLCLESKEPLLVTDNGYAKLVIMSIECYENLINLLSEAKQINEGISDFERGNLDNGENTIEELKNKYSLN